MWRQNVCPKTVPEMASIESGVCSGFCRIELYHIPTVRNQCFPRWFFCSIDSGVHAGLYDALQSRFPSQLMLRVDDLCRFYACCRLSQIKTIVPRRFGSIGSPSSVPQTSTDVMSVSSRQDPGTHQELVRHAWAHWLVRIFLVWHWTLRCGQHSSWWSTMKSLQCLQWGIQNGWPGSHGVARKHTAQPLRELWQCCE